MQLRNAVIKSEDGYIERLAMAREEARGGEKRKRRNWYQIVDRNAFKMATKLDGSKLNFNFFIWCKLHLMPIGLILWPLWSYLIRSYVYYGRYHNKVRDGLIHVHMKCSSTVYLRATIWLICCKSRIPTQFIRDWARVKTCLPWRDKEKEKLREKER